MKENQNQLLATQVIRTERLTMSTVIAVDFDGTVVEHRFPEVGPEAAGAAEWLLKFVEAGAQIILWTVRSDYRSAWSDDFLADAVKWFRDRGIQLYGVNHNRDQGAWSGSPKVYANVIIDDTAIGCPLTKSPSGYKVVDWAVAGPMVMKIIEARKGIE